MLLYYFFSYRCCCCVIVFVVVVMCAYDRERERVGERDRQTDTDRQIKKRVSQTDKKEKESQKRETELNTEYIFFHVLLLNSNVYAITSVRGGRLRNNDNNKISTSFDRHFLSGRVGCHVLAL